MLKWLFVLAACIGAGYVGFAQPKDNNATIKGIITTSDGKPALNVTVRIENARWGGITDDNGAYILKNVKPGTWLIKVSAVAAAAQEKSVTVTAGQTIQADFILDENSSQLHEITVAGRNVNRVNRIVAKLPLSNLENPQVYNSVSSEIMKQQGITNFDDALRNVPGITRTWESTGRGGDGGAYFALRGFDAQPLLYNGLPGITSGNLDPADIEEIQVLKGPSGTLFGGIFYSYGGIINTITKKPYNTLGGEVGANFGSFGLKRFTLDLNTPLSKKEKIAFRVNAAYHKEESFQDAGFKKSFFVAPSLSYEVNNRLSFQVMAEVLDEERAVPPVFFHSSRLDPLPFKNVKELNLNNKLSFTSNDLTIKNPRLNFQAQALYKLSDSWSSQTVVSSGRVKSDGIYTYIWDDVSNDNKFSQYFQHTNHVTRTLDIQQNFNGDFKIGGLRNRLLVGLDFFNRKVTDKGSGTVFGRSVTPQGDIDYKDPFSGEEHPALPLTKAGMDQLLSGSGNANSVAINSSYSAYVSDILNLTPGLMLMASVRADYFNNKGDKTTGEGKYSQLAWSPKFGVVYQPIPDKVSIFANYMNAFINVAPREVMNVDSSNRRMKSFRPEHADQLELGVKAILLKDKIQATLSVYDIKVSDRVVTDARNQLDYVQGGKVRSKGVEIDIIARPLTGLSVIAGYSHNDIKVVSGAKDDFYAEEGRAPGGQGAPDLANLWATYSFHNGVLKNLGVGWGGNYASRYKVIDNSTTGIFYLPAYTVMNGSLFYNAKHFRITLTLNNITNEVYYTGYWSINPQKPRNFTAGIAFKL